MSLAFIGAIVPSVLGAVVAACPLVYQSLQKKRRRDAQRRLEAAQSELEAAQKELEAVAARKMVITLLHNASSATHEELQASKGRADAYESVIQELESLRTISDDTAKHLYEWVLKLASSRAQIVKTEDELVTRLSDQFSQLG